MISELASKSRAKSDTGDRIRIGPGIGIKLNSVWIFGVRRRRLSSGEQWRSASRREQELGEMINQPARAASPRCDHFRNNRTRASFAVAYTVL
ncbi:hypothetical protein EVAR_12465_1 [Eumeta japonica]|uniref:Uncharacterized protein n=1 Tax=Eumeta variegata TaxID=151549 RepID=A0A4C1TPH8_EUMVA|nr:hypothetical protein EVAR_12465_1 [Eumeta japonica]